MSEGSDNKEGFKSLRDRLMAAEQNAEPRGWNEPSEAVWQNIRKRLPGNRRLLLGIIPWLFFLGSSIAAGYFWWQLGQSEQSLKEQLSQNHQLSDSLQWVIDQCEEGQSSQASPATGSTEIKKERSSPASIAKGEEKFLSRTDPSNAIAISSLKKFESLSFASLPVSSGFGDYFHRYFRKGAPAGSATVDPVSNIGFLSTLPFNNIAIPISIERLPSLAVLKADPLTLPEGAGTRWSVEANASYGLLQPKARGIDPAVSELLNMNVDPGNSLRVEAIIHYNLSKRWSIGAGMAYTELNPVTSYQVDLLYDPALEIKNSDGHYHLDFEHSIPSAAGNIDLNFGLLRLDQDEIAEGDTLPFNFRGRQAFQMIGLPVLVNFRAFKVNNFRISLLGGAQLNYLSGVRTEITDFVVGHSKLHNRYSIMEAVPEQYEQWSGNLILGLMGSYTLFPRVDLQAGLRTQLPVSDIYRSGQTFSRFNDYSLSLGLSFDW